MKALYGITTHGIEFVTEAISAYKATLPETKQKLLKLQLLGFDEEIKEGALVILIPSLKWFLQNLDALHRIPAVVFIFDNPVQCDMLSPITLLDVREKRASYQYEFRKLTFDDIKKAVRNGLNSKRTITITREVLDVIPTLLYATRASFLNPINTYLYQIGDPSTRAQVKLCILNWMTTDLVLDVLEEKILSIFGSNKVSSSLKKLLGFFQTDLGIRGRNALQDYEKSKASGKPARYNSISEKYDLSVFDLKFIVRVLNRADSYKFVDKDTTFLYRNMGLSQKQTKQVKSIVRYIEEHGRNPTIKELSAYIKISYSLMRTNIKELEVKGYVVLNLHGSEPLIKLVNTEEGEQ